MITINLKIQNTELKKIYINVFYTTIPQFLIGTYVHTYSSIYTEHIDIYMHCNVNTNRMQVKYSSVNVEY